MLKSPKEKGSSFEREIAVTLKDIDPTVRRAIMSGAIGNILETECGDISNSLGLTIECKRTEKLKPYEFYDQAVREAKKNTIPVVAMRSNNKQALALLSWSDFRQLLSAAPSQKVAFSKPKREAIDTASSSTTLSLSKAWQTRKKNK